MSHYYRMHLAQIHNFLKNHDHVAQDVWRTQILLFNPLGKQVFIADSILTQEHNPASADSSWSYVLQFTCFKKYLNLIPNLQYLPVRHTQFAVVVQQRIYVFNPVVVDWPVKTNPA